MSDPIESIRREMFAKDCKHGRVEGGVCLYCGTTMAPPADAPRCICGDIGAWEACPVHHPQPAPADAPEAETPEAETPLREKLARFLDNAFGLHARPHHVTALVELVQVLMTTDAYKPQPIAAPEFDRPEPIAEAETPEARRGGVEATPTDYAISLMKLSVATDAKITLSVNSCKLILAELQTTRQALSACSNTDQWYDIVGTFTRERERLTADLAALRETVARLEQELQDANDGGGCHTT